MRKIHLYFGIAMVLAFLLTGQYMHHVFNHLKDMDPMPRALFRTGHLYILLFGLINVSLGSYLRLESPSIIRKAQILASSIVLLASCMIMVSFFIELPADEIERPIARYALYLILSGISLHGLINLRKTEHSS